MPALELIFAAMFLGQLPSGDLPEVRIRSGPYAFPQSVISVQTNLVSTVVTVRDRRGIPVGGLAQADFEIFDDGKPQAIKFFSVQDLTRPIPAPPQVESAGQFHAPGVTSRPPRSMALFFDDTHAALFDAHKSVVAAEKIVDEAGPLDRLALFTGSGRVFVDFTTGREKLHAALKKVIPHWSRRQLDPCITLDPYQAYAVANNLDASEVNAAVAKATACNCVSQDSACLAAQVAVAHDAAELAWDLYKSGSEDALDSLRIAVNRLAQMPENRILVMLSRGFVTGGMNRQKSEIINAALRAHIVMNGLNPEGLLPNIKPLRQMVLQQLMQETAEATGGKLVKNNNDITGALESLVALPDVSYTLGFTPLRDPDGKYHVLKVKLKNNHGYEVAARQGYWSDKSDPAKEPAQRRIDEAVLSNQEVAEIPTTLRVSVPAPDSGQPLAIRFKVDPRPLRFLAKDGRSMQELTFVAVLMNPAGEYLTGKQVVMDLALTQAKLASMQESGIEGLMDFPVAPGNYSIRAVVREAGQNRIAASSASFEVK